MPTTTQCFEIEGMNGEMMVKYSYKKIEGVAEDIEIEYVSLVIAGQQVFVKLTEHMIAHIVKNLDFEI